MYILFRTTATKMMATTVPRKVLYQRRRRLQLNVGVKRRMIVTVMKTGKVPKKARKQVAAVVYVLCTKHEMYEIVILHLNHRQNEQVAVTQNP